MVRPVDIVCDGVKYVAEEEGTALGGPGGGSFGYRRVGVLLGHCFIGGLGYFSCKILILQLSC